MSLVRQLGNTEANKKRMKMRAEAEAALDEILDSAIQEFEDEEDLSQKPEDAGGEKMGACGGAEGPD